MQPKPLSYLPFQVTCLGHYGIVYRLSGVGGYYAVVRCDIDVTRDLATFSTEAAARAWIAARQPPTATTAPTDTPHHQT
jgi:hypothetical protein